MKLLAGYSVPTLTKDGKLWAVHQIETCEALKENDAVINSYPTGTGKTKALLNAVRENGINRALIIAPINELINQYESSIIQFKNEFNMPHGVFAITSEKLDEMNHKAHAQTLRNILKSEKAIIITNPDIVHYVIMQKYGNRAMAGKLLIDLLRFPQLVAFDEFHYYDPSRMFFALVLITTARYFKINQKYMFMTATPAEEMLTFIKKLGLKTATIELPENTSEYQNVKVASPIYLEILKGKLDDHYQLIEEQLLKETSKDILIISESLSRLAKIALSLRKNGVDFGIITGPVEHSERQKNLQKRILLATTTIDVGYEINRPHKDRQGVDTIFFEARTSEDLIQRLGRAGRVFGKSKTDIPSKAFVCVPSNIYENVVRALENSSNRLEFSRALRNLIVSNSENIKREFLGPLRLVLGLYEDAFSLLFPKEDYKELLKDYFAFLESIFGLEVGIARNLWRDELDMYYLSVAAENRENDHFKEILKRNQQLCERISEIYKDEQSFLRALDIYRKFVENFIVAFRTKAKQVYVIDPRNICGSKSFVYDKIAVITRYQVKKLSSDAIPIDLRNEIKEAYEIIAPLEKSVKPTWKIKTQSDKKFFIPLDCRSQIINSSHFSNLDMEGVPVYTIEEESRCFYMDLYPLRSIVNGWERKILLGLDAIKAQSYLEEKPWECDLFPQ